MVADASKNKNELFEELKQARERIADLELKIGAFEAPDNEPSFITDEVFWKIINLSPLGIMIFDNEGVVLKANRYFAHMMGAPSPEHIVGINMPRDIQSKPVRDCVRDAIKNDESAYEGYYTSISGKKEVYIRVRLRRLTPNLLLGVFEDVTEYQQIVTALSQSEEKYRNVVDNLTEMVVVIVDWRFVFANAACFHIMGVPPDELIGREFLDFVAKEDQKMVAEHYSKRIAASNSTNTYEFRLKDMNDQTIWVANSARLVNWEGKDAVLSVLNNITPRVQAEQDLEALNYALQDLVAERTKDLVSKARELQNANKKLLELDAMKSAFLSSVSHELRTPLTSLLGFSHMTGKHFARHFAPLAEHDDQLGQKAEIIAGNLKIMEHEGRRLSRLVNTALDITRIESGRMPWNNTPTCLDALVEEAVLASSGEILAAVDVALKLEIVHHPPLMNLDQDKIRQVIRNLLHNAIKFTLRGEITARVRMAAQEGAELVEVQIQDTGEGINANDLEAIFDRFYQAGETTPDDAKPTGSGLGLYLSRQVVEHYGGRILVESQVGVGSTFTVQLPLARNSIMERVL